MRTFGTHMYDFTLLEEALMTPCFVKQVLRSCPSEFSDAQILDLFLGWMNGNDTIHSDFTDETDYRTYDVSEEHQQHCVSRRQPHRKMHHYRQSLSSDALNKKIHASGVQYQRRCKSFARAEEDRLTDATSVH